MLRKNSNGYTFSEAKQVANRRTTYPNKSKLKVVYGTRTNKFHFITKEDRDFNTSFSMSIYEFLNIKSSKKAILLLTGSNIFY